ncbi:ribosomal protein L36-domain-containing protein [Sordaria brevicollis]|uniref:Ribosomal protein n=1 Tax=Sordaria brevicollis TaxID=83679 RepID=A0AAE0U5T9_SORBR|nr:ribosomal protein L36-domain-containing protein [Sordaria brevicollis]
MSNLFKSLASSMRALSLAAPRATAAVNTTKTVCSTHQTRCLSQAVLSRRHVCTPLCSHNRPVAVSQSANNGLQSKQQSRGMKVHSAIKKRCEHCKVVRRKANKRQNGYLYIICPANPRHKQRQGYR